MESNTNKLIMGLLIATLFMVAFNSYKIGQLEDISIPTVTGGIATTAVSDIIPAGVPKIYGQELQVSFDDISPNDPYNADSTIRKLAQLDNGISLEGEDLERYINILYRKENGISCEYCCGARAIIFENGEPACGCAHSYAMRGLAKYLITNHGNKYSDDEILEEVAKWKTMFFPTQIQQKAAILKSNGIELSYTNLASNKYRGVERGASSAGGMVGGC